MKTSLNIQTASDSFNSGHLTAADMEQNINALQIKDCQTSFINKCSFCSNKKCVNAKTNELITA